MDLNLLAFETSSSRCGVALLTEHGAEPVVAVLEHEGAQEHAERLLPMARELLVRAGLAPEALQAVAFGQGPGGFTGLRVACGVAQGIALGLGIPVLPVVSHEAVAEVSGAAADDAVVVALDARMEEVYLAVYLRGDDGQWQTLQAPLLIAAGEVVPWTVHHLDAWSARAGRALRVRMAGDAWQVYAASIAAPPGWVRVQAERPQAQAVARLARRAWRDGGGVAAELAAPLYVRDKVAFTTAERERGQGGNPRAVSALAATQMLPMAQRDLDEVAELEAQVQSFPWTRGNFADALQAGYPACVLRQDGRLAGFCVMMAAPDVVHLLVIAVPRHLHRQGLGGLMLGWCERQARARGLAGVLLEVRPSNATAVQFYERHGYLRIGRRKDYYPAGKGKREDALVMQKTLGEATVGDERA